MFECVRYILFSFILRLPCVPRASWKPQGVLGQTPIGLRNPGGFPSECELSFTPCFTYHCNDVTPKAFPWTSLLLFCLESPPCPWMNAWLFLENLGGALCLPGTKKQMGDVVTGASTVATSLSSAAVSLAGPFLKQASKQVDDSSTKHQYHHKGGDFSFEQQTLVPCSTLQQGFKNKSWEGVSHRRYFVECCPGVYECNIYAAVLAGAGRLVRKPGQ